MHEKFHFRRQRVCANGHRTHRAHSRPGCQLSRPSPLPSAAGAFLAVCSLPGSLDKAQRNAAQLELCAHRILDEADVGIWQPDAGTQVRAGRVTHQPERISHLRRPTKSANVGGREAICRMYRSDSGAGGGRSNCSCSSHRLRTGLGMVVFHLS